MRLCESTFMCLPLLSTVALAQSLDAPPNSSPCITGPCYQCKDEGSLHAGFMWGRVSEIPYPQKGTVQTIHL